MVFESLDSLAPRGYVDNSAAAVAPNTAARSANVQVTTATATYGASSAPAQEKYTGCNGACTIQRNAPACLAGCQKPCCKKEKHACPKDCAKPCCKKEKPACPKNCCKPCCKKEKPACPKDCAKPCCKPTGSSWGMYAAAYIVWFIIATIIFYVILAAFQPSWLMDKKEHHGGHNGGHNNDAKGDHGGNGHGQGEDGGHHGEEFNVGKAIGVSLLFALFSLIILQLILWAVGW